MIQKRDSKEDELKSVTIFNNKGGVGKTTLICNLASFLSKQKSKKVIIVDADPQCNSTIYLCSEKTVNSLYGSSKRKGTIHELIKPLSKGVGYNNRIPILQSERFEVDLIPGDPRLSLMEDLLSRDWGDATNGNPRGLQTSLVFYEVCKRLSAYDFVFFDVGPSLGAINRAVILGTDYFVIPVSADIFSIRAIENIGVAFHTWIEELNDGLQRYRKREKEQYSITGQKVTVSPQYIGYVVQQYTSKMVKGRKEPVIAFEKIIKRIPNALKRSLEELKHKNARKLGDVPTLQSLIPLSQSANAPIFDLKAKDGVVGSHFNRVKIFNKIIQTITKNFLEVIND